MTPPEPIPFISVAGSHREVGRQIGEAFAGFVRESVEFDADIPSGRTREEQLALAARYRAVTAEAYPWLMEEIEGVAEAAGVDALAYFAASIEEIWYEPRVRQTVGRCSDLVAGPAATANGHLLLGHNNDLYPKSEPGLAAIEKKVPGEPVVFQIGGEFGLSVGFNSAGIALTGNELSPNDEKVGISRSHQVFEMLRARTLDEAVAAALRPDRASSYNNILSDRKGRVVNVEGSATDAELTGLDENDHLVHTNNYVCERMLPYEGDPDYAPRSNTRYLRAKGLLAAQPAGTVTEAKLREILSDHENAPDCLCRHPERFGGNTKTVFWCTVDMDEMRVTYGRGNPCDSTAQEYAFA